MKKSRNSLFELYRIFLCFWAMYFHNFFFMEKTEAFPVAPLTVDFFFVISGFFLIPSMEKLREEKILRGACKLMMSRLKPISFPIFFSAVFNAVCIAVFIRSDLFDVLFTNFCYWWYILYLVIAIAILYIFYRIIKNKIAYAVFLFALMLSMLAFHYALEVRGFFIYEFTFVARAFGCLSLGMLCSYIPRWKTKGFNPSIIFVIVLAPLLFYLAYGEKTYALSVGMIALFAALVYFTANVNVSSKPLDIIGKMSSRMYVYMSFISMISVLGFTDNKALFLIDVSISVIDLLFATYYRKYRELKRSLKKID